METVEELERRLREETKVWKELIEALKKAREQSRRLLSRVLGLLGITEEELWLALHRVHIPKQLLNDRTRQIIKNRQGFSPTTFVKEGEECFRTLKQISYYFPSRKLMAEWLERYYWQGIKDVERELNRMNIKFTWKHIGNKWKRRKLLKALRSGVGLEALTELDKDLHEAFLKEKFSRWERLEKGLGTRRTKEWLTLGHLKSHRFRRYKGRGEE